MTRSITERVASRLLEHVANVGSTSVDSVCRSLGISKNEAERAVTSLFATGMLQIRGDAITLSSKAADFSTPVQSAAKWLGHAAAEHEGLRTDLIVATGAFRRALSDESAVIVGRRGAGKTLLARLLMNEASLRRTAAIEVNTVLASEHILLRIKESQDEFNRTRVAENGWRAWIWAELLHLLIREGRLPLDLIPVETLPRDEDAPSRILEQLFLWLSSEDLQGVGYKRSAKSSIAKTLALAVDTLRRDAPVLVVIDTLERHPVYNELHEALAGGQLWAAFTLPRELPEVMVIKCFARSEIFNYTLLRSVPNPMKLAAAVSHLIWNSKDLADLAARRLDKAFSQSSEGSSHARHAELSRWGTLNRVLSHLLPETIISQSGLREPAFLYLLRHTQMTPRHVIVGLRSILEAAANHGDSEQVSEEAFVEGMDRLAPSLAFETINAARDVYPQIESVIRLLERIPQIFPGNLLDRLWHQGGRSIQVAEALWNRDIFREVLVDSGVIGLVVEETEFYAHTAFQFASDRRLVLSERSLCAVHPIFAEYLRLPAGKLMVLPRVGDSAISDA